MNRIFVILLGSLLSTLLLPSSSFAATNEVQRITISLIGYAEQDPVVKTDSTETVTTFKQKVAVFRISTRDIINKIGVLMGQTFSKKASLYLDDEENLVIEDRGAETVVPSETASANLRWDAVARRMSAYSVESESKQYLKFGTHDYSTFTLDLKIGESTYHLKGFSIGSYRVIEDRLQDKSYERWSETAWVMGEADPTGDGELPVRGHVFVYERNTSNP